MRLFRVLSIAALVSAGATSGASALSLDVPAAAPLEVTPVGNGYGPVPYGLYGHRKHRSTRSRRSYGTGDDSRGTVTGGPPGGNPSRN